jgi:Anti-sigma-K factor rskA
MHPSPDVLALLALGEQAGTPEERAHVESCPECRTEIAGLARAVAAGRAGRADDSGLIAPPDRVWQTIRAELGLAVEPAAEASGSAGPPEGATVTGLSRPGAVQQNGSAPDEPGPEQVRPATVTPISQAPSRSSRGLRSVAVLVAAAVALVLGIGLGLGLDRLLGPRETVLWTAELQALPAFAGSSGEAVIEEDGEGNRTLVVTLDSPVPVDGSRAVWLIDRNVQQMRMLGSLNGDSGAWPVPPDVDPRQYPIVDVSKEPPGDPDTRHSGTSIVRGTLDV